MIDLHCHMLPAVDDGPSDLEAALALARAQQHAGVRTAVATPHVTAEHAHNLSAEIADRVEGLRCAIATEGDIELELLAGGEVDLWRAAELSDDELDALKLGGGPWLLAESPLRPGASFDGLVHDLQSRGHRLLLAHPERCPAFQSDPSKLANLVYGGVLTSITAGAFVGRFGDTVRRFTQRLVADGLVHSVASDAHGADRRRPGLRAELEVSGLGSMVAWWTEEVPAAILAGDRIPPAPDAPVGSGRRGLRILRSRRRR